MEQENRRWMQSAACEGCPDTSIFFAREDDTESIEAAKSFCRVCPVRAECLEFALRRREKWGIYGGLTPQERYPNRKKWVKLR